MQEYKDPLGDYHNDQPEQPTSAPVPEQMVPQAPPNKKIVLFVSLKNIPLDISNINYNLIELLKPFNIDETVPYEVLLPKSWYNAKQTNQLIESLATDGIRAVSYDINYKNIDSMVNNTDATIFLWNGSDNRIAKMIANYEFSKHAHSYKIIDPNSKSMWSHADHVDAICVTTNGSYKVYDGNSRKKAFAHTGMGAALQANILVSNFSELLGEKLYNKGNHVHNLGRYKRAAIISFPTKPEKIIVNQDKTNVVSWLKDKVQPNEELRGFLSKGDIKLIEQSFNELIDLIDKHKFKSVLIPRPGCGSGELDFKEDIVPIIKNNPRVMENIDKLFIAMFSKGRVPLKDLIDK